MKTTYAISLALFLLVFASCKDDAQITPTGGGDPVVTEDNSTLSMFAQEWVLSETFTDGIQKTWDGKQINLFSEDGAYFLKRWENWEAIGSYHFVDSDSTAISMTLNGLNYPIHMDIKKLNKNQLNIEFISGGQTLNYNYTR